jgi:hypothetical protein
VTDPFLGLIAHPLTVVAYMLAAVVVFDELT